MTVHLHSLKQLFKFAGFRLAKRQLSVSCVAKQVVGGVKMPDTDFTPEKYEVCVSFVLLYIKTFIYAVLYIYDPVFFMSYILHDGKSF